MFINEMHKLNDAQRAKLRSMFAGRTARLVAVDDGTDRITIEFEKSTHFLILGPRGGVHDHTIRSN